MKFEIKNHRTGEIAYTLEGDDFKTAIEAAIKSGIVFKSALFFKLDFFGVDLKNASFVGSRFAGSSFVNSSFDGSSFVDSRFDGSRFDGSSFVDSEMPPEYLTQVRDDFWAVLSAQPAEIDGLRQALVEGRVNGGQYAGECACLVGTIAKVAHCEFDNLPRLKPNSRRLSEVFFLSIHEGDTPDNSVCAKLAVGWLDEWVENVRGAFAARSER